jgi:osmotically-inducible protein OsmY
MARSKVVVKDEILANRVQVQLSKRGIRVPCRVRVSVLKGEVTLSGELQYEIQRKTALRAVREVAGVRAINDNLQVSPPSAAWKRK